MAQIGWYVAADVSGGYQLEDRSPLNNDASVVVGAGQPAGTFWQPLYSGCDGLTIIPFVGNLAGAQAPDHAAYNPLGTGDFTIFMCAAVAGGSPTEFYGTLCHSNGPGANRKIVVGFELLGPPSRTCLYVSDGSVSARLTSAPWPVGFIPTGTAVPGGGGTTMEGMYAVAVRRVGSLFTFFFKGAVYRLDGSVVDPATGLSTTVGPAIVNGTATSSVMPGSISGPLIIGGGGDNAAFGCTVKTPWAMLYNEGLPDEEIITTLNAAFALCGGSTVVDPSERLQTFVYNGGLELIGKGLAALTEGDKGDSLLLLLRTTYVPSRDHRVIADISAHEVTVRGYVRQAVSATTTRDDANDRAVYTASGDLWDMNPGQTVGAVVLAVLDFAPDTERRLISCHAIDPTPTGGIFQLQWKSFAQGGAILFRSPAT